MPEITMLEAIREALFEEMDRDPAVVTLGEDIGVYGGAFKVTEGLLAKFGPRARNRYADQRDGHRGRGLRHELSGLRPVAEMQFIDFIACCFNQVTNFVAKSHYRWGAPVPMVIARAFRRRRSRRAVSFGESGDVFRAHAGAESGLSFDGVRCEGPAEIRDPRQQSGAVFRTQVFVSPRERGSSRGRLHGADRQSRRAPRRARI